MALNQATMRQGLSFSTVPGLLVEHIEKKSFPDSLRWLFTTGKGATRQLLVYRQIRVPDLAAGAFLTGLAAGAAIAVLVTPFGIALPVLLLAAIAAQHVRSRFETPLKRWRSVTAAIAIDGALLLAYFTGRVAGLAGSSGSGPGVQAAAIARAESAGRARDASPASVISNRTRPRRPLGASRGCPRSWR